MKKSLYSEYTKDDPSRINYYAKKGYTFDNYETELVNKYQISISLHHVLIRLESDTRDPELFLYELPITEVLHIAPRVLKILWKYRLISKEQVLLAFRQWSEEENYLIFNKTDWRGLQKESIQIPVKRRGNEHYHQYTWSQLQWYSMIFDSYPLIYRKTAEKRPHTINQTVNRTIHKCNTILLTLTYPQDSSLQETWSRTTADINRFLTNLKNRLKRRNKKILFYFKALEAHENGYPHVHILMKLDSSFDFYSVRKGKYKKGTKLMPFTDTKKLFKWSYGNYDLLGMTNSESKVYVMKYITKITNENKNTTSMSLAMTWINNKRLYSTSVVDLLKEKFPNTHLFFKKSFPKKPTMPKFTANRAVDLLWNGFKFPRIRWNTERRATHRFPVRVRSDNLSLVILREPLPTRLNYDGFYELTALRCVRNQKSTLLPLSVQSRAQPDPKDRNNPHASMRRNKGINPYEVNIIIRKIPEVKQNEKIKPYPQSLPRLRLGMEDNK